MIKISFNQWDHIEAVRNESFIDVTTHYLIERFQPLALADFPVFRQEVKAVVAAGEEWGLRSGNVLLMHALASKVVGHDYADILPSVGHVLRSSEIDDQVKSQYLESWLRSLHDRQVGVKPD